MKTYLEQMLAILFFGLINCSLNAQLMEEFILQDSVDVNQQFFIDLNDDGKNDLVYNTGNSTFIKLKEGPRAFSDPILLEAGGQFIALEDMDNDGDLDLIRCRANGLFVHENLGGLSFDSGIDLGLIIGIKDFTLGDFNNDGFLDIATGAGTLGFPNDEILVWFENNGGLNFESHIMGTDQRIVFRIEAIDINEDGNQDLLVYYSEIEEIHQYINDGNENFILSSNIIEGTFYRPTVFQKADINADGRDDLLLGIINWDYSKSYWLQNNIGEDWTFRTIKGFSHTGSYSSSHCFPIDADGDNDLDIYLSTGYNDGIYLMTNNGTGQFSETLLFSEDENSNFSHLAADYIDDKPGLDVVYWTKKGNHEYIASWIEFLPDTTNLDCPPGDVFIEDQEDIDEYYSLYPNCKEIEGSLIIGEEFGEWNDITSLFKLSSIEKINGDLEVHYILNMDSLDAFSNLKYIGGELAFTVIKNIDNFDALKNIEYIGSSIEFRNCQELKDFTFMNAIDTIHGDLTYYLNFRSSTDGLERIKRVEGDLTVFRCFATAFETLDLSNLEYVEGSMRVTFNDNLQRIYLDNLNYVGEHFVIGSETNFLKEIRGAQLDYISGWYTISSGALSKLPKLELLEHVEERFTLNVSQAITDLSFLSSLDTVKENVIIHAPGLTNIEMLNEIDYIGGFELRFAPITDLSFIAKYDSLPYGYSLRDLPNLEVLNGLEQMQSVSRFSLSFNESLTDLSGVNPDLLIQDNLSIKGNPVLDMCNETFICNHIESGGITTLTENGTSCDEIEDISCTVNTSDVRSTTTFTITPNPNSSNFRIAYSNQPLSKDVKFFVADIYGKLVSVKQRNHLTFEHDLASGLYFLNIKSGNEMFTAKFVVVR